MLSEFPSIEVARGRTARELRPFKERQRWAFERSADAVAHALFMEPGTGKTKVLLETFNRAYARDRVDVLLLFAPGGAHRELLRYEVPKDFAPPYTTAFFDTGCKAAERREWDQARAVAGQPVILAMPIELLSHASGLKKALEVATARRCLVAFDESQRLKTPSATRTRNAWKVAKHAVLRRILSGTSNDGGWEDLYAQFRALDWRIIGCSTYAEFRTQYCITVGEYHKIVGYRRLDELKLRLEQFMTSVRLDECADLPARIVERVHVELGPKQREAYNALRDEFLYELESGALIEAPQIGVRIARLQQVVSGHLRDPEARVHDFAECPRLARCVQLVEDAPDKVIVWARFRHDVDRVTAALTAAGVGAVPIHGTVPMAQRMERLTQFRADAAVKALVATPDTLGESFTINEAKVVVWYSHVWSYIARFQAERRNYRHGQLKPVVYYELYAPGTVDARVLGVQARKGDVARDVQTVGAFREWLAPREEEEEPPGEAA